MKTLTSNFVQTLVQAIQTHWHQPAISNWEGESYTFADVAQQIVKIHAQFAAQDIQQGDKIVLIGKNQANWGIAYLAIVSYGAVVVPLLVDFKPKDIAHLISHSDSVAIMAGSIIAKDLDQAQISKLKLHIRLDDLSVVHAHKPTTSQINTLTEPGSFTTPHIDNQALLGIIYTSGTSGNSKGVMLNHDSLMANIEFARENMPLQGGDKIVSFLPMAHAYGCAFEFLFPFSLGCHITILGRIPSPQVILKAFGEVKPRLILMVPLVIEKVYKSKLAPALQKKSVQFMLRVPILKNLVYSKIRKQLSEAFGGNFVEVIIGGAALNPEVEAFLRKIKFPYTVGYGMTECGPLISYASHTQARLGSSGTPVHTLEVKIRTENADDTDGEIMVRGNNVMLGYYKNPEATAEVLEPDGWLHTGDLGHMDAEKFIYIRGRSKSLILGASGKNIYPEEIEAHFNNLEFVIESLAVLKENRNTILLYLDPDKTRDTQTDTIHQWVRDAIARINLEMPSYYAIKAYELMPNEFEKTAKRSIKRYLYQNS